MMGMPMKSENQIESNPQIILGVGIPGELRQNTKQEQLCYIPI